jgi:hypothetical protein
MSVSRSLAATRVQTYLAPHVTATEGCAAAAAAASVTLPH